MVDNKPAAAGLKTRRGAGVDQLHRCSSVRIVGEWLSQALAFVRRHEEGGIAHAERPEDSILQKRSQALPGHNLDDAADNVGGMAVIPRGSWLIDQWQLGKRGDEFGVAEIARQKLSGLGGIMRKQMRLA